MANYGQLGFNQLSQISPPEGTTSRDPREVWMPAGGSSAGKYDTADRMLYGALATIGVGGAAYGMFKYYNRTAEVLRNNPLYTTGRANALSGSGFTTNLLDTILPTHQPLYGGKQEPIDFFHGIARRVENSTFGEVFGFKGAYFSDIFNIFARAAGLSQATGIYAPRGGERYFFSLASDKLSVGSRKDTVRYLERYVLGVPLEGIDHLYWQDGEVHKAFVDPQTGRLVSDADEFSFLGRARVTGKGRVSAGLLTVLDPSLGLKDPRSNEARVQKIFGESRYVLLPEDMSKGFNVLGRNITVPDRLVTAEGYFAAAMQRTSYLMEELVGELRGAAEFFSPSAKKTTFRGARRLGLLPSYTLGDGMSMLGRYTGTATKVGLGLAALGQAGFMMQHGNRVEGTIGLVGSAVAASYIGSRVAEAFKKSPSVGAAVGLVAGLSGMLPGSPFEGGLIPGAARVVGGAQVLRSRLGEMTMMNDWRRSIEEVAPGATGVVPSIGMGIAAGVLYTTARRSFSEDDVITLADRRAVLRVLDWQRLSDFEGRDFRSMVTANPADLDVYAWRHVERMPQVERDAVFREIEDYRDQLVKQKNLAEVQNRFWEPGETKKIGSNRLAEILQNRATEKVKDEIASMPVQKGFVGQAKGLLKKVDAVVRKGSFIRGGIYASMVGALGYFAATGGLGTLETPDEMSGKNKGEILEEVRRSQGWEFGQTPYAGNDILYHRPTLTARLSSGVMQSGINGKRGPIEEFFLKNFTYQLERENYYDRPAPITSGAFDDMPFLYPLIKPIGDLIKRPKLMHVDEWARTNNGTIEYKELESLEALPSREMGGLGMAAPVAPNSPGRVWGRAWEQTTATAGLVGFYAREIVKTMTGVDGFFNDRPQLESFSENTSPSRAFYELHGGGGFLGVPFVSEGIRRFLMEDKNENYNVIRNELPDWLPATFRYGNPKATLNHGEGSYRLPGAGYAALHPELKGVDAKDYPLLHKLKILGDIAPWSAEYRNMNKEAKDLFKAGHYSPDQFRLIKNVESMAAKKAEGETFDPYVFRDDNFTTIDAKITSVNTGNMTFQVEGYKAPFRLAGVSNDREDIIAGLNAGVKEAGRAQQRNANEFRNLLEGKNARITIGRAIGPGTVRDGAVEAIVDIGGDSASRVMVDNTDASYDSSLMGRAAMLDPLARTFAKYPEGLLHGMSKMAQPVEHMLTFGFAPVSKFLHKKDALEEYEARYLYGESVKLWQHPVRDWVMPALKTGARNWLGMEFISPKIQKQRDVENHMDALQYYKQRSLAAQDSPHSSIFKNIANNTIAGGTGFVHESLLSAELKGAEANFAVAFAREQNLGRRKEIMEALPEHKQRIMAGQWAFQKMNALDSLGDGVNPMGKAFQQSLAILKEDRGYQRTEESMSDYNRFGGKEESFADFMSRKETGQTLGNSTPSPDWVGFNPLVEMEDVKVKYIKNEGMDLHDMGVYPRRVSMLNRKPYVPNGPGDNTFNAGTRIHGQQALQQVSNMMGGNHGSLRYDVSGPGRKMNNIQVNLTKYHNILPSGD